MDIEDMIYIIGSIGFIVFAISLAGPVLYM